MFPISLNSLRFPGCLACIYLLFSCSSSIPDVPATNSPLSDPSTEQQFDPGDALIVADFDLIREPVGSDLVIAYTAAALEASASADYIAAQWSDMSLCLDVASVPVAIIVEDGWLDATPSNDVLFSIEGRRLASFTQFPSSSDILAVSSYDFDGSQGRAGFHLRSIMGRYLWTHSARPAEDYNSSCASSI